MNDKKKDDGKYTWKKGDVLIHKNEKEMMAEMARQGYKEFWAPGKRPKKLK